MTPPTSLLAITVDLDDEVASPTFYSVKFIDGASRGIWTTSKRFSEFAALKSLLQSRGFALPTDVTFPPKTPSLLTALGFCAPMSVDQLTTRAAGLELFWRAVFNDFPETWDSPLAKEFFRPGEPTAYLPAPKPPPPPPAAKNVANGATTDEAKGADEEASVPRPRRPSLFDMVRSSFMGKPQEELKQMPVVVLAAAAPASSTPPTDT